jgi:hypothetical protein
MAGHPTGAMPDPKLEAAYRDTDYRVEDAPTGPFVIRVGNVCVDLEQLLFDEVAFDWAFVTACNPHSRRLSDDENARRMAELETAITAHGWDHYRGASAGSDGDWREPSFLVLGITEGDAVELARRFGQNAIVAGRAGEPARLIWTVSPVS